MWMRKEWPLLMRFYTELKQTVLYSWYVKTMGICPFLEITTKNQTFLEKVSSPAQFRLIDLLLAMTVYQPVRHSHCTRAGFTVLVSCSGKLAVHSCSLLCLEGQVSVCRLAFFRPNFINLASFQIGWRKILIGLLALFWLFHLEKFSSGGKYYYSFFSATDL